MELISIRRELIAVLIVFNTGVKGSIASMMSLLQIFDEEIIKLKYRNTPDIALHAWILISRYLSATGIFQHYSLIYPLGQGSHLQYQGHTALHRFDFPPLTHLIYSTKSLIIS